MDEPALLVLILLVLVAIINMRAHSLGAFAHHAHSSLIVPQNCILESIIRRKKQGCPPLGECKSSPTIRLHTAEIYSPEENVNFGGWTLCYHGPAMIPHPTLL